MPYEFAARQLAEVVLEVMREHAGLRIEVDVAPRQVDPLAQGYDIMLTVPREPLPIPAWWPSACSICAAPWWSRPRCWTGSGP